MNLYKIIYQVAGKLHEVQTALYDDFPEEKIRETIEKVHGQPVTIVSIREVFS